MRYRVGHQDLRSQSAPGAGQPILAVSGNAKLNFPLRDTACGLSFPVDLVE
ncbi:hypothetical protein [Sphingobium chungbukense]|uniref:hypothetical protein n=1 Tax=Sphingobium chungbukense TaxID=56193 RepID=UPI000B2F6FCB|nr:hypothetical protein [Sphingobium chungbukense]